MLVKVQYSSKVIVWSSVCTIKNKQNNISFRTFCLKIDRHRLNSSSYSKFEGKLTPLSSRAIWWQDCTPKPPTEILDTPRLRFIAFIGLHGVIFDVVHVNIFPWYFFCE